MSQIRAALDRIRLSSRKGGLAKLAQEAGVKRGTARDLLNDNHSAVKKLLALEAVVDKREAGAEK